MLWLSACQLLLLFPLLRRQLMVHHVMLMLLPVA